MKFGRRPNLCHHRLWQSQPLRAVERVTTEQISSNLSELVQRLQWEGCSLVRPTPSPFEPPPPPPPVCPRLEASMPARHKRRRLELSDGVWRSAGRRSGLEKEPELRRAGTGLISSPLCVFSVRKSTCHLAKKKKNRNKDFKVTKCMSVTAEAF